MEDDQQFLGDDAENDASLRLENDIMKLKLQAEFGAQFDEMANGVSPELEQQFLKQVYDFEKAWDRQEPTTVASLLGKPLFKPIGEISDKALVNAFEAAINLYKEKNISVDFLNEYPLEIKYRFITEELPAHETMFVNMPGMLLGFIYEEFHPNYAADIEEKVKSFLEGWFAKDMEQCGFQVSSEFILSNGLMLSKEDFINKLSQLFDSFTQFEEFEYFIAETSYDKQETATDDEEELALGYAEGGIKWKANLENGESIIFSGPFKFYLEYRYHCWTIMYFHLPGWKW